MDMKCMAAEYPTSRKKLGTPATSPRGEYLLLFSFHLGEFKWLALGISMALAFPLMLLKCLLMEIASFWAGHEHVMNDASYSLLSRGDKIERLSIKGCHLLARDTIFAPRSHRDLPQEVIVQMVRNRPQLRWLRSDLTPKNVAVLQQERPGITFVSE
jgi:hypothetical protein